MQAADTGEPEIPLFTVPEFRQRLLQFGGESEERREAARDEVLYVLEGSGVATVGGDGEQLAPGTVLFVARGTPWRFASAGNSYVQVQYYLLPGQ